MIRYRQRHIIHEHCF